MGERDPLYGRQVHVYDRGEYWEAVVTKPKQTVHVKKQDVDTYDRMKIEARKIFSDILAVSRRN